ncbi:unnamed protein product [Ambrosiozyma monospora]|uniref:Unnamed protein product n=1 Tax=Ambrosiozyma monospora TaxID=43982 RepID=A0ACB5U6D5_AMBMO|nr:unnamed protein product [Ambrosiozyma monospora]
MSENEFIQVPLKSSKKKNTKSKAKLSSSKSKSQSESKDTTLLLEKFETKLESLKSSKLYESVIQQLGGFTNNEGTIHTTVDTSSDNFQNSTTNILQNNNTTITSHSTKPSPKWNKIRCLAIGSISTEFQNWINYVY